MAAQTGGEVKIRVRFDTEGAKADLDELAKRAAGITTGGGRGPGTDGRGGGKDGGGGGYVPAFLGGMFGSAMGQIAGNLTGPSAAGFGTMASDVLGIQGTKLANSIFGKMAPEARAAEVARAQTEEAFGMFAGVSGKVPSGAASFFNARKNMLTQQFSGEQMIEMDPQFRGELSKKIDAFVENAVNVLLEHATSKAGGAGGLIMRGIDESLRGAKR